MASSAGPRVSAAARAVRMPMVQGRPEVENAASRVSVIQAVAPATVSPEAKMMRCTLDNAV
ncbi:Uncharacterised protein [Mycobacteroides abscessus]|nr:Uncharacterised protein [Mycobacteroides abscessus]SHV00361.1 Uncharacterised protein [Mycobacteroides abscessus subsp. abscessus]SKG81267.1 Uncharacterised protein [Mycobacteroides abscessus subsp. bolletii]SHW45165.1 Uncharacterised protein [Mycobacteroides abscessus subsp. abscessus]SIN20752.1 Uncharacterised protein [Mycobacteroides abscessus subsp. abscessus]